MNHYYIILSTFLQIRVRLQTRLSVGMKQRGIRKGWIIKCNESYLNASHCLTRAVPPMQIRSLQNLD